MSEGGAGEAAERGGGLENARSVNQGLYPVYALFLVEARDLDEAISIAARVPVARKGTVEIRPVLELPDLPRVES